MRLWCRGRLRRNFVVVLVSWINGFLQGKISFKEVILVLKWFWPKINISVRMIETPRNGRNHLKQFGIKTGTKWEGHLYQFGHRNMIFRLYRPVRYKIVSLYIYISKKIYCQNCSDRWYYKIHFRYINLVNMHRIKDGSWTKFVCFFKRIRIFYSNTMSCLKANHLSGPSPQ